MSKYPFAALVVEESTTELSLLGSSMTICLRHWQLFFTDNVLFYVSSVVFSFRQIWPKGPKLWNVLIQYKHFGIIYTTIKFILKIIDVSSGY